MNNNSKSNVVRGVTSLLLLLLFITAIGVILKFTQVGDEVVDIVNPVFRVNYDGISYTGDNNQICLPQSGKAKFTVKCTNGFKVKVTPNITDKTNFTYTVNGQEYQYGDEDLTGYIVASDDIYADCFYIDCDKDYCLENLLSRIWGGANVILNGTVQYPYRLIVTSSNGDSVVIELTALIIKFSESEIIF